VTFPSDAELMAWIRENLYVAVVCDVLDSLGQRDRSMHQRLRPLDDDCCAFAGRARTIQWAPVEYIVEEDPYGLEIDAVDALRPGDVVVHSTDHAGSNAPWGELMTTAAMQRGAVGCVCDSQIRDTARIKQMRFPVFHAGIRPVDSKGRGLVVAVDVPIRCGEVLVRPLDVVFADPDGVVVIPSGLVADVLEAAALKAARENDTRSGLLQGRLLREMYDEHGVL